MKRLLLSIIFLFSVFITLQAQRLISGTSIGTRTAAQLTIDTGIPMPNDVFLYKIRYETPDLYGVTDTASGLLVIPDIPGQLPLVCYQHGTVGEKAAIPSNLQSEAVIAMAMSSLGYAVIAPDYLGLGDSRGFHPYMHAESEASVAIDMIKATKDFAPSIMLDLSDQLFITGYSQGGHAAMALFRELETNHSMDLPVTAAAPMSGPYSVSGVMVDQLFLPDPYFYPAYLPYTLNSYQMAYGNIYSSLSELYRPGYDSLVQDFLDRNITMGQLNNGLINKLTQDFGAPIARMMFLDSMQTVIRTDSMHPFNVAMRLNDVYDWTPQAPMRMFYCEADDQVFFQNSIVADSVMNARGAANVKAMSVGETLDHVDCATPAALNTLFFFNPFLPSNSIKKDQLLDLFWHLDQQGNGFVFQMATPSLQTASFRFSDLQGRTLVQAEVSLAHRQEIPLGELTAGVYLAEIISPEGLWRKKIWVK